MQAHEEIIWVTDTQYGGSRAWVAGVLVILFGSVLVVGGALWSSYGWLAAGAFFVLVGIPFEYQCIKQGGTNFFLTTFRLVKTKKGKILKELSRRSFTGKSLSSFLRVIHAPQTTGPQRKWQTVENLHVDILDPNSGNVLMSLGWIPEPSVKALETITQAVYCQYCGRSNSPTNTTCSECGANL